MSECVCECVDAREGGRGEGVAREAQLREEGTTAATRQGRRVQQERDDGWNE